MYIEDLTLITLKGYERHHLRMLEKLKEKEKNILDKWIYFGDRRGTIEPHLLKIESYTNTIRELSEEEIVNQDDEEILDEISRMKFNLEREKYKEKLKIYEINKHKDQVEFFNKCFNINAAYMDYIKSSISSVRNTMDLAANPTTIPESIPRDTNFYRLLDEYKRICDDLKYIRNTCKISEPSLEERDKMLETYSRNIECVKKRKLHNSRYFYYSIFSPLEEERNKYKEHIGRIIDIENLIEICYDSALEINEYYYQSV